MVYADPTDPNTNVDPLTGQPKKPPTSFQTLPLGNPGTATPPTIAYPTPAPTSASTPWLPGPVTSQAAASQEAPETPTNPTTPPSTPPAYFPENPAAPGQPLSPTGPANPSLNPPAAASTSDYTTLGTFGGQMGPWSDPNNPKYQGAFGDRSGRYQLMSVFSHFDPSQGISAALLKALNDNKVDGAVWTGSGDQLFRNGVPDDVVQGIHSAHPTWTAWQGDDRQTTATTATPAAGTGTGTGSGLGPLPSLPPLPGGSGGGTGSSGTGTTSTSGTVEPPAQTPQTAPNAEWEALYQDLLKRSQQSLTVDPNDPAIKAQTDAASAVANRDRLTQMQQAAERGGAYATGATANDARMSGEAVQLQNSALQAQLMGREVDARRTEIQNALTSMQGILTVEEQSRLKQEDQALQSRSIELANQQASAQNELNARIAAQNEQQMEWERMFQDRGWNAQQAQQIWQNEQSQF